MINAIVSDLLATDSVYSGEIGLAWNHDRDTAPGGCSLFMATEPQNLLQQCGSLYSYFWPIFPEDWEHGITLLRAAEDMGYRLCCSSAEAMLLAADKAECLRQLAGTGIKLVPCWSGDSDHSDIPEQYAASMWVRKPRRGTGGKGCRLFDSFSRARQAGGNKDDLLQPYIKGINGSISMVCANNKATVLAGNMQNITLSEEACTLHEIAVNNFDAASADKLQQLASSIAAAIPGLLGFIGADFICQDDGSLVLLEVNPRVTSSYPGLRQALGVNPTRWLAPLFADIDMPPAPATGRADSHTVTVRINHEP